jgi:predicted 3-demethylubiquinone-9 3-methyltransferase (glyoxalase superfamily)
VDQLDDVVFPEPVEGIRTVWPQCRGVRVEIFSVPVDDGGPVFTFSEAISFMVGCETQEEIDYFWDKLSEEGAKGKCGWLKDKYGVSWQIVPTILPKLLRDKDPAKSQRVTRAMLQMTKLDIDRLKQAYEQ